MKAFFIPLGQTQESHGRISNLKLKGAIFHDLLRFEWCVKVMD